jgi:hypothetical protein
VGGAVAAIAAGSSLCARRLAIGGTITSNRCSRLSPHGDAMLGTIILIVLIIIPIGPLPI